MQVEQLAISKKKAEKNYLALQQAFKQNATLKKDAVRTDLKRVYGHMRHGKKIIDVYESFKTTGLNADGDPKLAICRADAKQCFCNKRENGQALFSMNEKGMWDRRCKSHGDILLPQETFTWQPKDAEREVGAYNIKNEKIQTIVPIIPAKILVAEVKVLLKNFHILWEVEHWKPIPPRDPILLKRLTPNLFGVLATWDLTELERAVIRGRINEA